MQQQQQPYQDIFDPNRYNNYPPPLGYSTRGGYGINMNSYRGRRGNGGRGGQQRDRWNGPPQLQLADYMPPQLRVPTPPPGSSRLPSILTEFDLANVRPVVSRPPTPTYALPQRQRRAGTTTTTAATTTTMNKTRNITQPFIFPNSQDPPPNVPQNGDVPQQQQQQQEQRQGTASFRRRQRRLKQQQYQTTNNMADDRSDVSSVINENVDEIPNEDGEEEKKQEKKPKKMRLYLDPTRMLRWLQDNAQATINGRSNQSYALAAAPIYDIWVRNNYELQVWQEYLKLGTNEQHWAKEVVQRTKKRDNIINSQFVQKKIARLTNEIAKASATISDLQVQLGTYLTQQPMTTNATSVANSNRSREVIERLEKAILKYIRHCTQHVGQMAVNRVKLATIQLTEYKALKDFESIAAPSQWNTHLLIKTRMSTLITKSKNYRIALKRVEYDLPPKFLSKFKFSFRFDEALIGEEESQEIYNEMRALTKDFRIRSMTLCVKAAQREYELIEDQVKTICEGMPKEVGNDLDGEAGLVAFEEYHHRRQERWRTQQRSTDCRPDSDSFIGRGFLAPTVINQAQLKLTEEEHHLLKLGPRFIFNDPKTASRRRVTELATLKRKIESRFFDKKVRPGRPVEEFIAELDILLQNLHDTPVSRRPQSHIQQQQHPIIPYDTLASTIQSSQSYIVRPSRNNYGRIVKRLVHRFRITNTVLRKTDKSKVFHVGRLDHYRKKSEEYMNKTNAYRCLGINDPLPSLVERTNKYLLDLRLAKWITQKQYEQLCVNPVEAELAHLYYLPKAHKPGTPLRPIMSGLRHPTLKISKFLDDLLRPLFDKMAKETTIGNGFELVKQINEWSNNGGLRSETLFCTMDVTDLYTMVPQIEGVLSLKKMLDYLGLKQVGGLRTETIIRLARFVMQNNYFLFDRQYYHQIRGGAMGSPLTLTIANCYMFFFERDIIKQVQNSGGLYLRYIDDIFSIVNWPERHCLQQIKRWNKFDDNIKLTANITTTADFLDLHIENNDGTLRTNVYHKPSYEPYYLPFNSVHPMHIKRNIPFVMLLRAIRYCSTFQAYLNERASLRMALLLNKYPGEFIDTQFNRVFSKFNITQQLNILNYNALREKVIKHPEKEKTVVDYNTSMFVHFTYCSGMKPFPSKFHFLWEKYFGQSPIADVMPILGTRNVANLQQRLVHTKKN